jgi:hypothetical protein
MPWLSLELGDKDGLQRSYGTAISRRSLQVGAFVDAKGEGLEWPGLLQRKFLVLTQRRLDTTISRSPTLRPALFQRFQRVKFQQRYQMRHRNSRSVGAISRRSQELPRSSSRSSLRMCGPFWRACSRKNQSRARPSPAKPVLQGYRQPGGVSRRGDPWLGGCLAAPQPARRV